ncbi:MAG: porin family protein [Bacteroidetes bacterium]|nr:porin family protein [Bacteroidota bacterium]
MRKVIILIAFALCTSVFSYGQFALGIKIGYNGSKLNTNLDSIKSDFNSGFHVGAWAHFGKRLYFAPEVLYCMSGGVFTNGSVADPNYWSQKIKVGSFDVPLMVGFKIIHSDFITWRIELGPEASFVMNTTISEEKGLNPKLQASDINKANWYVLGGTGIDVLFLTFDIRYKYGLSNLINDVENQSFDTKNNVFLVSLGWKIFGKK